MRGVRAREGPRVRESAGFMEAIRNTETVSCAGEPISLGREARAVESIIACTGSQTGWCAGFPAEAGDLNTGGGEDDRR